MRFALVYDGSPVHQVGDVALYHGQHVEQLARGQSYVVTKVDIEMLDRPL